MAIRAQLVTDYLPLKFSAAVRAAVLFYAPLLYHLDQQGPGVPTFTRACAATFVGRDGGLHAVLADQPTFEASGEIPQGLFYGRTGAGSRSADDDCRWTAGANFTKRDTVGSYAFLCDPDTLGTFIAVGETYDYSGGAGAGIEKTYTAAGLDHQVLTATQPADLHDGRLTDVGPINRHLKHVCTFTRVLTDSEMVAVLTALEAA